MTLSEDDLAVIDRRVDQRIRLASSREKTSGTVVSRDTTGPKAMVRFDGATVAVPVKVAGSVYVQAGDRCLLDRYGTSDWIVTNSFGASSFGEASRSLDGLSIATGSLTSATFVDLTEFGTVSFDKAFDLTFVRVQVNSACFVSAVPTRILWAVRFTPTAGGIGYTPTDISVGGMNFNTASQHQAYTGMRRIISIPSGSYTVSLRWRRASGTGNAVADTNDSYAVELDERVRASVPIL